MKDGNVVYMHLINPVVKGADYTVLAILYEANPDPRRSARFSRSTAMHSRRAWAAARSQPPSTSRSRNAL